MDQYSLVHRLEIQQNIREMVRWHKNHPSVILWEPILNESHMPAQFQQRVHDIVHEEYPVDPCYTGSDYGPMVFIASYWGELSAK